MKIVINKYGLFLFSKKRIKTGDMVVHFQSGTNYPIIRPQQPNEDWNGYTNSLTGKRSYYPLILFIPFNK